MKRADGPVEAAAREQELAGFAQDFLLALGR